MDGTETVWTHRGGAPILASPRVAEDVVPVSNLADVIVAQIEQRANQSGGTHNNSIRNEPECAYGAPQPLLGVRVVGFSDGTLAGLDLDSRIAAQRRIGEGPILT